MGSFDVTDYTTDGDVHVIEVAGYVDFDVAPQLKKFIVGRIEQGDRRLVVDLSTAGFIDSTAIGVLVGALKRMRTAGGSLVVVCSDNNVFSTFEIVGLEHVIPLYRSREDALSALASAV